jgi:hypothetical protein
MAVNRFSTIQGLPEWQPQIPLELLSKALIYKQELFDKNLNLIRSDVASQQNIADNILNGAAKNEYVAKVNAFKNNLNKNFAFADLTDDMVLSGIGKDMLKIVDDQTFVSHVQKSNTVREGIKKYKEAREKGNGKDNFYTGAQEALSMDSYNDYINAEDPNQALNVSLRGFKQDIDVPGLMQEALKGIADFKDKNVQLTEMGWMYRMDKYSTVDQQKIMNRLQPLLSRADVQDQLYADAFYRYRDNPNTILNQSVQNYQSKISTLEQQNKVYERNIVTNHRNAEAVSYNRGLIERNKKTIESYQKEVGDQQQMLSSINPSALTKEDKLKLRNLGKQLYTEQTVNPFAQSFAISEHDIDLKENPQKKAMFEAQQAMLRLTTEYSLKWEFEKKKMGAILGEQQTFTSTEDLSDQDFTDEKISADLKTYSTGMENSKAALARELQKEYESHLSEAELSSPKRWLFVTSTGGFNMGNVDYWIKHRTINGLPGSASVTGRLKTQKTEQLFSQYDDNRVKLAAIQENEKAVTDKIISGKNEKVGNTDLRTLYAQYGSQLYKEGANVHPYTGQRVRGINLEIKKEIVSKYGEETWDKLTSLNKDVSSEKTKYRKEVYGAHTRLGVIDLPGVYTVGKDGNTKELTDGFVSYMNVLAKQNQLDVRFDKSTISSVVHEKRSNGKTYHLITVGGKVNDEGKLVGGETIEVEDNDVTNTRYKIKDTQFYNRVGQYTMGRLDGSKTTPTTDAGLLTSSNGSTHFAYVEDANGTFTFKIKGVKSGKVTYRTSFDKYLTNNYNPGVTKEAVLDAIDWISQNVGDIGVMTEQELANALTQYNNSK